MTYLIIPKNCTPTEPFLLILLTSLLRGNATEWNDKTEICAKTSTTISPFSHRSRMPPWPLRNCRFPLCILAECSLVSSPPRRSLLSGASAAQSARHLLAGTLAKIQTISLQHRNQQGGYHDRHSLKCPFLPGTGNLWKRSLLFLTIERGRNNTDDILCDP